MTKRATLPFLVTAISGLVLAVVLTASGSAATVGATAPSSSGAPAASAAKAGGAQTIARNAQGRMTSRLVGESSQGQRVSGTFTPLEFSQDDAGQLVVQGLVEGVVKKGGKPTTFAVVRTLPVASLNGVAPTASSGGGQFAPASAPINCDILNLVLGPLDLDLLGLQIHLDRVVLNIIAAAGAGNLLGNLLCAVAGLLDGGLAGLLGQLVTLLNQILANLRLGG